MSNETQTLKIYREQRLKEIAADASEPANMVVEELLERAFDAALDFVRCNHLRVLETLMADVKARADNEGLDPYTACEEISELITASPWIRFTEDLKATEHWTNGWMFDGEPDESLPRDLRAKGWAVAVHNDYKLPDGMCTFWLMTKRIGNQTIALKGEGHTDRIALDIIREQVSKLERDATFGG